MPDQPTDDSQTSGSSKNKLQSFRDMTAYAKGIYLAQNAENASNLLEEDSHNLDNVNIVRRLHMYSGHAIAMCKRLHEVNNPPYDDKPTLMKAMPWLRARTRGLRLGAYYRAHGRFLLEKDATDNFADICNMYLCGSYVTELGWQLDDLEAAQTEHGNTVAALEAQNDTLQAQNDTMGIQNNALKSRNDEMQAQIDQLQAQLHALKIEKAATKPDVSALSGPEIFEHLQSLVQQSKKFLDPGQTTSADSDQTRIDTSDTLASKPTEQEKQDVEMTGTAASPHEIMLPDTPDNDDNNSEPSPKTPQKTKGKASAPALSPSKAAGSPKKGQTKPTKGGIPGFMGTTAAAAAKSRPPVHKQGARPVTPDRGSGQPAPATREEIHTGDRRRIGHIPNISPPSPSVTPSKKQRQGTRKMAVREIGAKKGGKKR